MTAGSSGIAADVRADVYISDARTRSISTDSEQSLRDRRREAAAQELHRHAERRRRSRAGGFRIRPGASRRRGRCRARRSRRGRANRARWEASHDRPRSPAPSCPARPRSPRTCRRCGRRRARGPRADAASSSVLAASRSPDAHAACAWRPAMAAGSTPDSTAPRYSSTARMRVGLQHPIGMTHQRVAHLLIVDETDPVVVARVAAGGVVREALRELGAEVDEAVHRDRGVHGRAHQRAPAGRCASAAPRRSRASRHRRRSTRAATGRVREAPRRALR